MFCFFRFDLNLLVMHNAWKPTLKPIAFFNEKFKLSNQTIWVDYCYVAMIELVHSLTKLSFFAYQFPDDLEAATDASVPASQTTAATVVPSTQTTRTSPCKLLCKKSSRQMIASGLLLVGSIVCLSRGRSNLGAQLAMAFFLKKAFKQQRESGPSTSRGRTDVTRSRR